MTPFDWFRNFITSLTFAIGKTCYAVIKEIEPKVFLSCAARGQVIS